MKRDSLFDRPGAWLQGAMLAKVVSLDDPESQNRVQVRLFGNDAVGENDAPLCARVVCPFAGNDRGAFFLPDVDDEVLVVFVGGDTRYPLIVGGLWNGAATPPASIESGGNNRYKRIKSKNGIVITMDEQQGQETLKLETPGGQSFTLKDGPGQVTVQDSNGNTVEMASSAMTITASANVKINAPMVEVKAGMVKVDAAFTKFSGIVQCQTLISTTVISSAYTPGAGNIW